MREESELWIEDLLRNVTQLSLFNVNPIVEQYMFFLARRCDMPIFMLRHALSLYMHGWNVNKLFQMKRGCRAY